MKNGGTVKISLPDLGVGNFGAELRAVLIMDLWLGGVMAAKLLIGERRCEVLSSVLFFFFAIYQGCGVVKKNDSGNCDQKSLIYQFFPTSPIYVY